MADYTPEQRNEERARKTVVDFMQKYGKGKISLGNVEIEQLMYAWLLKPALLDPNSKEAANLLFQSISDHGKDTFSVIPVLQAMRHLSTMFAEAYPGAHRNPSAQEKMIFEMALSFLEAVVAVFLPKDETFSIFEQIFIHMSMLHNYREDVKLFYKNSTRGWTICPIFARWICQHVCDTEGNNARFSFMNIGMVCAEYYGASGEKWSINKAYTRNSGIGNLLEPCLWMELFAGSRKVLFRMGQTAPDIKHLLWINAANRNLLHLFIDAYQRNQLPLSILRHRPLFRSLIESESESESESVNIEELERMGIFENDRVEKEKTPAKLELLSNDSRNALIAKLKNRWSGDVPPNDDELESFTKAIHTELGSDCESCVSAPKQIIYQECAHCFMCESCFKNQYQQNGECPVCRTFSDVVFLLPVPQPPSV